MTQAEFNKLKTEWIKTESWRVSGIDVDLRTYITMRGNDPAKYDSWFWFYSGVKAQEYQDEEHADGYSCIPFGKLVGTFSWEYDFWHRENNPDQYNQDMPDGFHLEDRDIIGGII